MDDLLQAVPVRRALVGPLGIVSLGAAAIHFSVIGAHFEEWWAFGVAMAAIGWFQALWPIAYLRRQTVWLAALGALANLGIAGVWAWSRIDGLPFGPGAGAPMPIGVPDLIAVGLELVLVVVLVASWIGPIRREAAVRRMTGRASVAWSALIALAVGVATSAAIAHGMGPL